MRGSGSSGTSSIGVNARLRRRPVPETLVGNSLQSALARLRNSDPLFGSALDDRKRRIVEHAERVRSDLLAAADRFGRGADGDDGAGDLTPDTEFDLDAGVAQFAQVLAERDDLDDAGRDREMAALRDELMMRTLFAGLDAAGERTGLPGMEAFVAGAEETLAGASDQDIEPRQTHVQARLRGRLEDRRRREEADRVTRTAAGRSARADRAAGLRSYLLDGVKTPADAREVLDSARADGALDGPALDRLDRILADRLSFERERDEALARIDDAIAGDMPGKSDVRAVSGLVEGDQPWFRESPWLDCHFERWLLARDGSNKGLFKKLPYLPMPEDLYRRCRHRLTRWPGLPDIVAYSRAVGATPPMVANRIAAQWETGGDRDKAQALEIADTIRNETGTEIDAPGLKKALSLVGAGSSPEQVVALRKADPRAFHDAGDEPAGDKGREIGSEETPGSGKISGRSAETPWIEDGEEENAKVPKLHELTRRQAEADLTPETLPRDDLAKRDGESWSLWGRRIYEALVEAHKAGPEETRKIARRFYGELKMPKNVEVVAAAKQHVSLAAYRNPPSEGLIDGAELEAFRAWQKENPGAKPSEYGLNQSFSAYLAADGNFYRHSDETSKHTGIHAELLNKTLASFENYASVLLGDFQHIWIAALGGGPSLGRSRPVAAVQSYVRFSRSGLTGQKPKPAEKPALRSGLTQEEWDAYEAELERIANARIPGVDFSFHTEVRYQTNAQLKKAWVKPHNRDWPMDPETGESQHLHHIIPLGDGGPDHVSNVMPMTKRMHMDHHKREGDHVRWAERKKVPGYTGMDKERKRNQ